MTGKKYTDFLKWLICLWILHLTSGQSPAQSQITTSAVQLQSMDNKYKVGPAILVKRHPVHMPKESKCGGVVRCGILIGTKPLEKSPDSIPPSPIKVTPPSAPSSPPPLKKSPPPPPPKPQWQQMMSNYIWWEDEKSGGTPPPPEQWKPLRFHIKPMPWPFSNLGRLWEQPPPKKEKKTILPKSTQPIFIGYGKPLPTHAPVPIQWTVTAATPLPQLATIPNNPPVQYYIMPPSYTQMETPPQVVNVQPLPTQTEADTAKAGSEHVTQTQGKNLDEYLAKQFDSMSFEEFIKTVAAME